MKANVAKLCAAVLLTAQTVVLAQKTEVRVQKGKVVAEAGGQTVAVEAGRKAVLTPSARPAVSVDDPLVRDVLELRMLVEAEKARSDLKIDSSFILVGGAEGDEVRGALYFEVPNWQAAATDVLTLPSMSIIPDFQVYDLNGDLLTVETTLRDETTASYSIHAKEQVEPGAHFRFVGVANLNDIPLIPGGAPAYYREGPVWYFQTMNISSNCLNYFRFILPRSAILLDTNRPVIATDSVRGRVAVTMRNYTGPYADGSCMISLLYPEEDGTTLADIPDKYHGLRSKRDRENSQTFEREMHKIRAGARHTDQSTPLAALLTCLGSIIHKDIDLYTTVKYTERSPESIQAHVEQAGYYVDILDLLSTPEWPKNPGNGYVHPVYLCRKGSLIDEFIEPVVYHDGKWYDHNTKGKPSVDTKYATEDEIAEAKSKGYLCDWEVAGPYIQKGKTYKELLDIPFGPELPDVDVPWQRVSVEPHEQYLASVNLDNCLMHFDQSVAYLRTEIVSDRQKAARLEIRSDDGVKAWLNGTLIHENNVSRGIAEGQDTVDVTLNEGVNRLMLKITEDIWGSGAVVRVAPASAEARQN